MTVTPQQTLAHLRRLAVRDLPRERYFEAVADVMERIGGPVDLVRVEETAGSLRERIESEGQEV